MGEVKSAFEKAMEKLKEIEELTQEEKKELKERETLGALLTSFYKGELNKDQMWQGLRGLKPSLLEEAQDRIAGSLRLGNLTEEFLQRRDGILAIEALRERKNTAAVEDSLNTVGKVQKEYGAQKDRALKELRAAIEENPQLRLRQVRTPDGRVHQTPLSVDEAIQTKMAEFLAEHERRFEAMFAQAISRLREEVKGRNP